jgi:hypothetical protein
MSNRYDVRLSPGVARTDRRTASRSSGSRWGEYRVVLSVDEELRVINVVRIDGRTNVYR